MYLLIKKVLLLTILAYLKIAIILANSMHSTFLCICKVIADIFQLPASHLLNVSPTRNSDTQNISHRSSPKVSTFVQTEEQSKQLENAGSKSSTDVIIYNLSSTQKLVITQGNCKSNKCENCKFATEITTYEKVENVTAPSVGFDGSNISYMSIESDVVDSKIENGCYSSSTSSSTTISDGFNSQLVCIEDSEVKTANAENANNKRVSFGNVDTFLNSCDKLALDLEALDFECLKETESDNTSVKSDDKAANKHKTSSPLSKVLQNHQNVSTDLSMFKADQSQIPENKDLGTRTNLDNWKNEAFGTDFKRRLSLPVKLNTTNSAVMNFKLAQKMLIEDALKNTSRHEKSLKEIKYPFSSEISLDSKHNDETYDKGVFSCSSYESLPVSDHIRNAFNNSAVLSLYDETLHSEDKPDFSCVDHLVEGFEETKSNLSVLNLALDKIIPSTTTRKDEKHETKLCSDINLDSSVTEMCNVLNRFVTGEVKLIPEKFSNFSDKSLLTNGKDILQAGVNFENNEQFGINDCEVRRSSTKEYNSFDNSLRKQRNEEINKKSEEIDIGEPIVNEIKCTSSSSLKSVYLDVDEATDVENALLTLKYESETNKSDSCENLQKVWQQSYHKIAFIDESPPHETSHTNQNISETNCKDRSFNKDEKHTPIEVDFGDETNKFANNLLSIQQRWFKSFGEFTETDKNEPNEIACMSSSPNGKHADPVEWTGACENTVFSLKNKVGTNKPANSVKQQYKAFTDEIPLYELNHADQNTLETNCQEQQSTLFEENSSSGDSTSDNSVVTVKDLNVAEN
ncbi:uncharacterized protein [Parasteatoda tepidariorum]|uniref:uncharacterized protein n=1 Tax=Parasteatoda tepidariorum TaxID=114398 RepID=UPI00077F84C4|nr:serine-rich adhesin for platelets [Parasteatoda tepidariorum]